MALTEFKLALMQVSEERGIPMEDVIASIETALISAYKRDFGTPEGETEELTAKIDPDTGEAQILIAGKDVTPAGFGRIAAQTAKQVILQKIRETEKRVITEEFEDKVGTLITGTIFRIEPGKVILDLGKAHGVMPQSEQVETEMYRSNQRIKVYVKDVRQNTRGTEIIVSRSAPEFVVKLFEQEVPEIASGTVVIHAIAREAGSRTKMAVYSNDDKIDAVGSCVGQKGVRVQSIITELHGEKIDIVPYSPQIDKFIAASLSPARITAVEIDEKENKATVTVPEDQQSLAIGREGQNARLANKLTHYRIDIKGGKNLFDAETGKTMEAGAKNADAVVGIWDAAIKKVNKELEETKTDVTELAAEPTEAKDLIEVDDKVKEINKDEEPGQDTSEENTKDVEVTEEEPVTE